MHVKIYKIIRIKTDLKLINWETEKSLNRHTSKSTKFKKISNC